MYTFPNKKRYIGKTKRSLAQRQGKDWERYKKSRLLWNAIQKYGIDNIETDILFEGMITDDEANELETHYIEAYKTNANKYKHPCYGYNLTAGGEGVVDWEPTPERKEVLQRQMYDNGIKHRGKHLTDEHKKKLSEAHKGKSAKCKTVKATNPETGEVLWFDSLKKTAEYFGVTMSSACHWLSGMNKPKNNYNFEYCPRTTTDEVGSASAEYVTV